MFPKPTTFPTHNTHRMVLFLDQQLHGDYERIEDKLADMQLATRALPVSGSLSFPTRL